MANVVTENTTKNCVSLSWIFSFDGNAPIRGVNVSYMAIENFHPPHSNSISIAGSDNTSTRVCDLQPHTKYEFVVSATNDVGFSLPFSLSIATPPSG